MTIIATITNTLGRGIAFQTTTGGTAVENGATATLTLPDSAMADLLGYQAQGCTITYAQLPDVGPRTFYVGRKELPDTAYTVTNADSGYILEAINAAGCAVTFPATLNQGLNVGILRYGAGDVTWTAGSGATIRVPGAEVGVTAQYGMCSAYVRANPTGVAAEIIIAGNIT